MAIPLKRSRDPKAPEEAYYNDQKSGTQVDCAGVGCLRLLPQRSLEPVGEIAAFITYAREDRDFVLRLAEALELKGIRSAGDWQLVQGGNFDQQLAELQLDADALIFVLSPESVRSSPCATELDRAIAQRQRILPVLRRDLGADEQALPSALASLQWTFARPDDDFISGVKGIVEAINTDLELLPEHRRLSVAADIWLRNRRRKAFLLHGEALRQAERWLDETTASQPDRLPKPTAIQLEFIRESQTNRSKRARLAIIGGIIGFAVLTIISIVAILQRNKARTETVRADTERAAAQAARAGEEQRRIEAENAAKAANEAREKEKLARAGEEQRRIEAEAATRVATARQLAAEADRLRAQSDTQLPLAALVHAEAIRRSHTLEADYSLRQTLAILPGAPTLLGPGLIDYVSATMDGALIAVGSASGRGVQIISGRDGSIVKTLPDSGRPLAWERSARFLVAQTSGPLRFFDPQDWQSRSPVNSFTAELTLTPTGEFLLTADGTSSGDFVSVWNTSTGQLVRQVTHPSHVRKILVAGNLVASVYGQRSLTVRLWNLDTGKTVVEVPGEISALAVDETGRRVAIGDESGVVRVFDQSGTRLFELPHHRPIASLAFAGPYSMAVGAGNLVNRWLLQRTPILEGTIVLESAVDWVAYAGPGLIVGEHKSIRGWSGRQEVLRINPGKFFSGFIATRTGDRLVASLSSQPWERPAYPNTFLHPLPGLERASQLWLWPLKTGIESDVFDFEFALASTQELSAFIHEGAIVIQRRSSPILTIPHSGIVGFTPAVTRRGDFVAVAVEGGIQVWNAVTGRPEGKVPQPNAPDIAFNAAGDLLAASGATSAHVWRWKEGAAWGRINESAIPFRNPGVYTVRRGEPPALRPGQRIEMVSADRRIVASYHPDAKFLELWSASPHAKLCEISLDPFQAGDVSIALARDGRLVAASPGDGSIHVWDSQTCSERYRFLTSSDPRAQADRAMLVGFSDDSRYLLATRGFGFGYEGPIRMIPLDTKEVIRQVCERVGRDFTLDEWRRFLPGERCSGVCPGLPSCGAGTPQF